MTNRPVLPLFKDPRVIAQLPVSYFAFAAFLSLVAYGFVHPARSYETFLMLTLFTFPVWLWAARYVIHLVPASYPHRERSYFLTIPSAITLCVVGICVVNAIFDRSSMQTYTVPITATDQSIFGKEHYAVIPAFSPSKLSVIGFDGGLPIDADEHADIYTRKYNPETLVGSHVRVSVKSGFLGIPWVVSKEIQP